MRRYRRAVHNVVDAICSIPMAVHDAVFDVGRSYDRYRGDSCCDQQDCCESTCHGDCHHSGCRCGNNSRCWMSTDDYIVLTKKQIIDEKALDDLSCRNLKELLRYEIECLKREDVADHIRDLIKKGDNLRDRVKALEEAAAGKPPKR